MPKAIKPRLFNGSGGANTTQLDVVSAFPVYSDLSGCRVDRGPFVRVAGKARVHQFSQISNLVDADGTNDQVVLGQDTRIFPLGTRWTLEWLVYTDSVASDRFIVGRSSSGDTSITVKHTTTSTMVATIADSAGTTTTLTATGVAAAAKTRVLLARDGATVVLSVNGTAVSGSMSATNLVRLGDPLALFADSSASFYDGAIDFFRGFRTYFTDQRYGFLRLIDPRMASVMFDYVVSADANNFVRDRGFYENHGTALGTPATNRAPIAANSDPVLALWSALDTSNQRAGGALVRDRIYPTKWLS